MNPELLIACDRSLGRIVCGGDQDGRQPLVGSLDRWGERRVSGAMYWRSDIRVATAGQLTLTIARIAFDCGEIG